MAEGSGYGMVYTSDEAKKHLLQNNRDYNNRLTWQNMFNQNATQAQRAENKLVNQYTDASAAAYVSYLQNQNAIRNSKVVGVGKQTLLAENNQALIDAYNSYRSNLDEGITAIQDAKEEQDIAINEALQNQADMTVDYTKAHYDYLSELYNRYQNGENKLFDEGSQWYKYTTIDPMTDENGEYVFDENGNIVYDETSRRLKTTDELYAPSYDEVTNPDGSIKKEWTSLYDDEGNLTLAGVDFFDQIENQLANEGGYSWGQYLNETNPELAEWANSYNPYNYTEDGTNAGTMRTMYGMMSKDYTYEFAERLGGLTTEQLNSTFDKFETFSNDIATKLTESDGKLNDNEIHTSIGESIDEVSNLMSEMGITDDINEDLKEQYGITFDDLKAQIEQYIAQSYKNGDIAAGSAGAGAATGTMVGASSAAGGYVAGGTIGTIVGAGISIAGAASGSLAGMSIGAVAGPIGAVVGAIIGVVAGIIVGAVETNKVKNEMKEANYNSAKNLQSAYNNLLTTLTNYSASKKREVEINFGNQNIY